MNACLLSPRFSVTALRLEKTMGRPSGTKACGAKTTGDAPRAPSAEPDLPVDKARLLKATMAVIAPTLKKAMVIIRVTGRKRFITRLLDSLDFACLDIHFSLIGGALRQTSLLVIGIFLTASLGQP